MFHFADITFDPSEARLLRGERSIELQPKVHAALHLFLQRPGHLFSKEELLERLWPDTEVTEEVLTQTIWKLRRALGDDPREPRFIQTVLKRGYRFLPTPGAAPGEVSAAIQPPGASYDPAWYVPRPAEERTARRYLAYAGMPVVLLGPERVGKTWLLRHLLREARDGGRARTVALSLDLLARPAGSSLTQFLHELGLHIADALRVPQEAVQRCFARSASPQANLSWLLQEEILPPLQRAGERLLLGIDRADALAGCAFQDDFFGLLRAWAESGAEEAPWSCLRLLLAVSTAPLVQNPRQSPFNLTEPIRLHDFDELQLLRLAQLHGLAPAPAELARLQQVVGGHPYLCRLALYGARERDGAPLARLRAEDPVFGPFLEPHRARLQQAGLLQALGQVALDGGAALAPALHQQLVRGGFTVWDEALGRHRLRCPLYHTLLRAPR